MIINARLVIFDQPFETTSVTTSFLFLCQKQLRGEKKRARIKTKCEYERDVKKLLQNDCTNIISFNVIDE